MKLGTKKMVPPIVVPLVKVPEKVPGENHALADTA